jgi:hypothetical protein
MSPRPRARSTRVRSTTRAKCLSCRRSRPASHACRPWPRRRYGPPGAGDAMRCVYFPQALPPRCRRSGVTQRSLCWTGGGSVGGRGHRGSAAPAAHGVNPTPATAGRSPIPEGRGLPGRAGLAALLPARSRPGFRGRSAAWFRAGVGGRDLQGPSPQAQRCADVDKEGGTHQGRGLRSHGTTAIDKPLPDTKADCGSCWASSANRGTMLLVVDPLTSVAACRWRSPATRRHRLCRPAACRTPLHRAG